MNIPEQGQLVQLRYRFYVIQDVFKYNESGNTFHRVDLECLDDDRLGESLSVIWEVEAHKEILPDTGLPEPGNWDCPEAFQAFLLALRWSSASAFIEPPLHSAFRADIDIEDYQLEPVVRAITMPRANLLIADDVGLGKTVEAGLVMQELIARNRARKIMIVCPSSLQLQWKEEMEEKFRLPFRIVNREFVLQLRREYGVHVNPWNSYPRIITSMDFLKREVPLRQFKDSLQKKKRGMALRDWQLLIIDEAHNIAPAGKTKYIRDSSTIPKSHVSTRGYRFCLGIIFSNFFFNFCSLNYTQ